LIGAEHFYPTVELAVRACVAADTRTSATGYEPGADAGSDTEDTTG